MQLVEGRTQIRTAMERQSGVPHGCSTSSLRRGDWLDRLDFAINFDTWSGATNARRYSSTFQERERGEGKNEAGVVGLASKRMALEQNIMMGGNEKTFLLLQDLEFGMLHQSMPLFQFSFDSRLSYYISSILHGNAGESFRWGMIIQLVSWTCVDVPCHNTVSFFARPLLFTASSWPLFWQTR